MHDFRGELADQPLRFVAKISDQVTFRKAAIQRRTAELYGQKYNKPTEENIASLLDTARNMPGELGGHSMDMVSIAQAMIAAGGVGNDGSYLSASASIPDVRRLLPDGG